LPANAGGWSGTTSHRGFEAFAAGDMETLGKLFHADADWRGEAAGPLVGSYTGRDAIFAMFVQLHTETGGTFTSKPITYAASGDKVFVEAEAGGQRNGRARKFPEVVLFTLRDGQVRKVQIFQGDHEAAEAFWG
jgi:uncharacterized protein